MSALLKWLRSHWISEGEVRTEAWVLGIRQGRVLEGARSELNTPHLSVHRTILLKAVIRMHGR